MRLCRTTFRFLATVLTSAVLAVTLSGCAPDFTDEQALTQLRFNGIGLASGGAFVTPVGVNVNVGAASASDVFVLISNEAVSPGVSPDAIYDVIIEGYTVSYERTDAGSAIPAEFGTVFTTRIPASGFNSRTTTAVLIRLIPFEQTALPPLADLDHFGFEQSTGFTKIQTLATIRMFGRNRIGDVAEVTFQIPVTFCDLCAGQ